MNVDIHVADAHEPADFSIHRPVSQDDIDGLLCRMSNVYINWFGSGCVLASSSTGSLEEMITLRQTGEQDERYHVFAQSSVIYRVPLSSRKVYGRSSPTPPFLWRPTNRWRGLKSQRTFVHLVGK